MNRNDRRTIGAFVRRELGRRVKDIEYPGGKSRDSVRLILDDGKRVIATRRPSDERAEREVNILRKLHSNGASVPKVFAFDGQFLLQQDLGTERLSQSLHTKDHTFSIEEQLDSALTSMAAYQAAARKTDLTDNPRVIGGEKQWCEGLVNVPYEVAEMTGIAPPEYDREALADLLRVREPAFVKWDSRPGNALLSPSGAAYWFDWEHAGARNAQDDLVWLMGDEFVTYSAEMEARLFARHMPAFAGPYSPEELESYVRVMGCFHTCVRFELVLDNKGDGKWWSLQRCIDGDKVGVTLRCCRRLLWRAQAWADVDPKTRPLVGWFKDLEAYVEDL